MTNLKEQLIGVKNALLEHGRARGYLKDEAGCLCLLGAAGASVYGYDKVEDTTPFYSKLGSLSDAGPVVAALAAQADRSREPTDWAVSDISKVFVFNDQAVEDDEVFKLVDAAIEAA